MKIKAHPEHSKYYPKLCGVVDSRKYFYLIDGSVLRSLHDLRKILKSIKPEVFAHHVNSERNDFATWVRDVIKDYPLARKLRELKDPKVMEAYVNYRITWLEWKVKQKKR